MNTTKHLIFPERLRKIPRYFSWLDHKLVRNGYLKRCSSDGACLYLFLTCVGDQFGLSYYSDKAINKHLNIADLAIARRELLEADLIAYAKPFYQVLELRTISKQPAKPAVILDKTDPNYIPTSEEIKVILGGLSL